MNAPLYTAEILRLAASLPEPQRLQRLDGFAEERSSTCGSRVRLEVMLSPDGRIKAVSQEVHACAFGQASAALVANGAAGRDVREVERALDELASCLAGERSDPGSWAGVEALLPARTRKGRHGAILLPFRALAAALRRAAS